MSNDKINAAKHDEKSQDLLGQVRELLDCGLPPLAVNFRMRDIERALEEGCRGDVEKVLDALFRLQLGFAGRMLVRAQYVAAEYMRTAGRDARTMADFTPPALVEEHLPRVERIGRYLAETAETYGRVKRTLAKARNEAHGRASKQKGSCRAHRCPLLRKIVEDHSAGGLRRRNARTTSGPIEQHQARRAAETPATQADEAAPDSGEAGLATAALKTGQSDRVADPVSNSRS